ncbi:hypothetical protein FLJC2902T_06870 [Flavobacterium limnosediminis JC2902]|uniref:Calx-beta domain-containing protein n=1 Tax=Flavobacterium limnosediminis JC2902 TaxID=1341181 RepID=V6SRN3_9FLAO|nr:hypothetical protein FLJC2902T_06870 [Flavobacterium limnosediminis JC2902]
MFAAAAIGLLSSCSEDDDTTLERGTKPVVTAAETNFSVEEGQVVNLVLNTETPINKRMDFKLELVGGTASFRDYIVEGDGNNTTDEETNIDDGWGLIGHKVYFPAYASTHTVDITPIFDLLPEGTEEIKLKLTSMGNANGSVAAASEMITITVTNKTSNDFVAIADWSQTVTDSHGTLVEGDYVDNSGGDHHALCAFDFDLELYDSNFAVVEQDYDNCPAEITLAETAPNGAYFIVPSFWSRARPTTAIPAEDIKFKMKVTMAKPGVWHHVVNIDDVWKYSLGGANEGFADAYQVAGILIKTGTTYELQDVDGNVLAQGRMADFKLKSKKNRK